MRMADKEKNPQNIPDVTNQVVDEIASELSSCFDHKSRILAHISSLDLENERLSVSINNCENVRTDSCQLLLPDDLKTDLKYRNWFQERCDSEPDSDINEKENWRNKGQEEDTSLTKNIVLDARSIQMINLKSTGQDNSFLTQHFEKPDSILKEKENWRNRLKKDDVLLNKSLKLDSKFEEQKSKKRQCELKGRKPSKFFKRCPDIEIRQNTPALQYSKNTIILLKNGNSFMKPIELDNRKFIVRDTCPFDTIAEILAVAANDNSEYLKHLEGSSNLFCGFILVYIDSGAKPHVYGHRCLILKDFVDPQKPKTNLLVHKAASPFLVHSFSVFSCVYDMWTFLMKNEPSMYRIKKCTCGFLEIEEIPVLYVNYQIIAQEGFKAIQKSILEQDSITEEKCTQENCGLSRSIETKTNYHLFIEADIRKSTSLKTSMTCNVKNFPVYLILHGEIFRFVKYYS